jgi:iron complex outermembrane receptor protein
MSNELFKAVRYALYAGATAVVGISAAPVFAQDAQDQGGQQLETVTVTGSRIRKADVETAQPIVVLDRTTIEHQGFNSVADILQNLSEAGSPPISRSQVLASGEDVGGYYIDLRNIGNNRTLVLLNGKRLGATTSGAQDLSQVPMSAIERVEVLKDGASAIYGSDAIAGVVNIITRKNYDGAEASAYVGQFDEDDGAKQTYSMTFGSHNERGSLTVSAEYSKEDPVWAKNRSFSATPNGPLHPRSGWTPVSQWGVFFFPGSFNCGQADSPLGGCTLNPGGNPYNQNDWHGSNSAGGTSDLSNANEQMMVQTSIERHSLFVSGDYSITDNIKFSTDLLYNKRSTLQQVAGYPFSGNQLPGAATPYLGLSPQSYYNPVGDRFLGEGHGQMVYFYRRGWEVPRTTQSDLQTYRASGTLEGSFNIGDHTWNWDVGGYVNTNDLLQTNHGDFNKFALSQALGPSFLDNNTGLVTCGTPDHPLPYGSTPGSCIPWNPFYPAGTVGDGSLTGNPGLQQLLFPYYHTTGRTKTVDYSANITGSIFTLPAGDLGIAAGYEHRNETGKFVPDAFSQGNLSTNLSSGPTQGSYSVDEYYVEVDVPVLKDLPFARQLSFNVAGRYSDYSSFGETTNGKFSITWKPIDDLMVRGNYAQGFRAPTIADLYGGLGGSFEYYTDPCDTSYGAAAGNPAVLARCTGGIGQQPGTPGGFRQLGQGNVPCTNNPCQSGVNFYNGSNPNLQPETATSKTLGLVYSPSWIQGLDLSLDWFRIHIKSAIQQDSVDDILEDCYLRGIASRCSSSLFTRDPVTGVVNYVLYGQTNKGWVDTEGYDLGVNYRLPEFSFGRFALHWDTTYISHLDVKASDTAPVPQVLTSWGSNFRIRSNASLDWTLGDFGATWTTRYYSSIKEKCSYDLAGGPECNMPNHVAPDTGAGVYPTRRVGANTFHDLQVRWNAPWNGTIALGANNIFDHQQPILYSAPNSQFKNYGGFDIGRFYYLRYTQKF